jgi:predicted dehydrogenase
VASRAPALEVFGLEGTISLTGGELGGGEEGASLKLFQLATDRWADVAIEPEEPTRDLGVLHAVDCLCEGKPLLLTGELGRHLVDIMTGAARAAKTGCTVRMETSF